jgi:hypothetical protein
VRVVVRRSALRMWLLAMAGIPLLVIALDVITNRRITDRLRELLFRPNDTQLLEPRDVIWAWAMLAFAVFLIVWGLKELFVPTRIIETKPEGLMVRVGGPLRRPVIVPWRRVIDVDTTTIEDEERKVPLFLVEVDDPALLPANPWGARWVSEKELGILTEDWADDPAAVAEAIADYAVSEAVLVVDEATEEE